MQIYMALFVQDDWANCCAFVVAMSEERAIQLLALDDTDKLTAIYPIGIPNHPHSNEQLLFKELAC